MSNTQVSPILAVYKASAGSGKTYQLAYKYISLLLGRRTDSQGHIKLYSANERRRHREILAITFTNKATEEMKQRIINELFLLSHTELQSNYREMLMQAAGVNADTLARAAGEALTSLLFDFGNMQVSTIDTFFQRILRSFAYEADLTGNYELMLDNERMIQLAIADTLTMVCGMRGVTPLDRQHITQVRDWVSKMLDVNFQNSSEIKIFDKNSSIRRQLTRFIKDLSDETYQTISHQLDPFFNTPEAINDLLAELNKRQKELDSEIAAIAAEIKADPTGFNGRQMTMITKLAEGKVDALTTSNHNYLSGESSIDSLLTKKAGIDLRDKVERLISLLRARFTATVMIGQMYNLGLFKEVLNVADKMKVHLNTIMLSDTNTLLNKIISGSDTPFIYERIGQRLRNFLIDEFQDTSKLQWLNLHPLVINSISEGNDSMLIGDVKQCIYRFRNSYPELLDTQIQSDPSLNYAITLPAMTVNYRSTIEVVEFNNMIFEALGQRKGINSYATVRQQPQVKKGHGYVNVAACSDKTAGLDRMIEHMQRQLSSGYRPSDLVVLVRYNDDAAPIVERIMAESVPGGRLEGVQVVSDKALYVRSAGSVQYLVGKLRELDRIQRDPAEVARSPRTGLPPTTDRELQWLTNTLEELNSTTDSTPDANLEELLKRFDQRGHLASLPADQDAEWRARARGRSVFEIVEELVRDMPNESWLTTEVQYIAAFQDLVLEYCQINAPSVHGFLQLWDDRLERTAAIGLSADSNAIRIFTIHKAKGLEFTCAHIPMLCQKMNKIKGHKWFSTKGIATQLDLQCATPDYFPLNSAAANVRSSLFAPQIKSTEDEAFVDELNALYVAFTRAGSELIVTTNTKSDPATNLAQVLGYPADADWQHTVGSPTRCADPEAAASTTLRIPAYKVYDRLDTWHHTNIADPTLCNQTKGNSQMSVF